jgi:lysophospholipase L1-like esterase
LHRHLFEVKENPHGILFNPISVIGALQDYMEHKQYSTNDLFQLNDLFNSWHHHTRFSDITASATLEKINSSISDAHRYLKVADKLIITLGSAWLYSLTNDAPHHAGLVVANNHKAPAKWFEKKLMDPVELSSQLRKIVTAIHALNSKIKIIFTISPVRHLREGLIENNRSKSVLIYAVHDVIANLKGVEYFPAYEYVIDDLRDYRFYAEDLVHPNYAATNYVWDKLVGTYFSEETQLIMGEVAELQLAKQHKPFNKASIAHQAFLQKSLVKSQVLQSKYPYLPMTDFISFFSGELINKV